MAEIISFQNSKEDFFRLAKKAVDEGKREKAISYLDQAIALDERYFDAHIMRASVYSDIGEYHMSNVMIYRALALEPDETTDDILWGSLGFNFLQMGDKDAAYYYLRDFGDDVEIGVEEDADVKAVKAALGDNFSGPMEHGAAALMNAYRLLAERKFDKAAAIVRAVPDDAPYSDEANHLEVMTYILRNDFDGAIYAANSILWRKDVLSVRCALATVYIMEERMDEARVTAEKLLDREYEKAEEIFAVLPVFLSCEMHEAVLKYTEKLLDKVKLMPNVMLWCSQAQYNLGMKAEARRTLYRMKSLYREFCSADYYLTLYAKNPKRVEYAVATADALPYSERMGRKRLIKDYYERMNGATFEAAIENDDELFELMRWAIAENIDELSGVLINKMAAAGGRKAEKFLRDMLIIPGLGFITVSRLVCALVEVCGGSAADFYVVAQDRFKHIELEMPDAYAVMPSKLRDATECAITDIIYADEEPNYFLQRLTEIVNGIVNLGADGKAVMRDGLHKADIAAMRSFKTLVGVLLVKTYEEEDPKEYTLERYDISARTFNKYYEIIFGEKNGEK